jgi:hypothetical protein
MRQSRFKDEQVHRDSEGAPGWAVDAGSVPQVWRQRRHVLQVALEVRRHGRVGRAEAEGVGGENRRLKKLAESMLDALMLNEMLRKNF